MRSNLITCNVVLFLFVNQGLMVNLGYTKLTLEGMVGNLAIGKDGCRGEHNPNLGNSNDDGQDAFNGRYVVETVKAHTHTTILRLSISQTPVPCSTTQLREWVMSE